MLFRSRRRPKGRLGAWRAFAERLELSDAGDQGERLRRWLDLGEGQVAPVYGLKREGQPTLYLFDQERERRGPAGTVRLVRSGVLLRWHQGRVAAPWRATPRRSQAMEAIEAGRTGSTRLDLAGEGPFDDDVSVFARDEAAARGMLSLPVREVVRRLLVGRGEPLLLVVGEGHLLVTGEGGEGTDLAVLESVTTDLLTLYALLVLPA